MSEINKVKKRTIIDNDDNDDNVRDNNSVSTKDIDNRDDDQDYKEFLKQKRKKEKEEQQRKFEQEQEDNIPLWKKIFYVVIRYAAIMIVFFILQKLLTGRGPFDLVTLSADESLIQKYSSYCPPGSQSCRDIIRDKLNGKDK
ncbi:hypothetical protein CYY_008380 [Polysphondylium violaceum]|uniref:Uncharacterized protein n=1 Tax=Polysphondylium violaceum TaxID=133409 RepID=A0A8J4PLQ9_9MYCE|nr:hypothetical protein CYY_008380 [Polysphondylium violaceum]